MFDLGLGNRRLVAARVRKDKELLYRILAETSFLPDNSALGLRLWHIQNNTQEMGKCVLCGNPTKFDNGLFNYRRHCSNICVGKNQEVRDKVRKTSLDRFGAESNLQADSVKEQIKQTNLKRYGTENPLGSLQIRKKITKTMKDRYGVSSTLKFDSVKEKTKQTLLAKYGVERVGQAMEVRRKIKEKLLEKYGADNPLKVEEIKERAKRTNLEKYGSESYSGSPATKLKFIEGLVNSGRLKGIVEPLFDVNTYTGCKIKYDWKCCKCGNVFESNGRIPRCYICFPRIVSRYEDEIEHWLGELGVSFTKHDRNIIAPKELDFYLPDYKLAIEFNSLHFHKEGNGKDKSYHLEKTESCEANGIQLIHVFEDEWVEKQEIVKSIIKSKLGKVERKIYARNCTVQEVSKKELSDFLVTNHLGGSVGCKYACGLFHKGELVQVVAFGKSRYNKKYDWELVRSCTKMNTEVVGGFSRLMSSIVLGSVVSYVDRRYFNGKGYKDWNYVGRTDPGFYYVNGSGERFSRLKFQKYKLKRRFPEIYNDELTGCEFMQLAGYDKIWDVGNLVFAQRRDKI